MAGRQGKKRWAAKLILTGGAREAMTVGCKPTKLIEMIMITSSKGLRVHLTKCLFVSHCDLWGRFGGGGFAFGN